jgi:hypothetical protein
MKGKSVMFRAIAGLLVALALSSTAHSNISALPYQAGAGTKTESTAPPESTKKIVEEIQADYEKVLERLNKADPGAQTRKNQKRILDNIDKLLQQQDPNQGGANIKPGAGNPPMPMSPSPQESKPMPHNPPRHVEGKEQQPTPLTTPKANNVAAKPKAEVGGSQRGKEANTFEEMKEEAKSNDEWRLPRRLRQEMDTFARERFIRNYEETLRAYYRNIADGSRRKDVE